MTDANDLRSDDPIKSDKLKKISSIETDLTTAGVWAFRAVENIPYAEQILNALTSNMDVKRVMRRVGYDHPKTNVLSYADGQTYGRSRPLSQTTCVFRTIQKYYNTGNPKPGESSFQDIDSAAACASGTHTFPPTPMCGQYSIHRYNATSSYTGQPLYYTDGNECHVLRRLAEYRFTRQQYGFEYGNASDTVNTFLDPKVAYNPGLKFCSTRPSWRSWR